MHGNEQIIDVAVAVIIRNQQVLLTYRSKQQDCGECWEFPGGKFEQGESLQQALRRECAEELGIQIELSQPWLSVQHAYAKYTVRLHICLVERFDGEPHGLEDQAMRWVPFDDLHRHQFPAANKVIVDCLAVL